jgi:hypothetical protein
MNSAAANVSEPSEASLIQREVKYRIKLPEALVDSASVVNSVAVEIYWALIDEVSDIEG